VPTADGFSTTGQAFQVALVDPDGLVERASGVTPKDELLGEIGDGVHLLADPNDIVVTWIGFPCETRPRLEISEAAGDAMRIVVDRGPRESFCPAMEVGYGVELVLKRSVEETDFEFSIAPRQEP